MDAKQRKRQRELAEERDARGVCILCESDKEPRRYGLCSMHRQRLEAMLREHPEEQHEAIKSDLIDRGMLMPLRQGRRVTGEQNEFRVAAAEFLTDHAPARPAAVGAVIAGAADPAVIDELSTADAPPADAPPKKSDRQARPKNTRKPA